MGKSYRRRYHRGARDKYSVEQMAGAFDIPAGQQAYNQVVPDTTIGGMRKVKHLTVSMCSMDTNDTLLSETGVWALVYVPQGTSVNALNLTGTSLYEPNQFVMSCGTFDSNAGPVRIHSPVSRNLNSGDKIYLIVANANTTRRMYMNYVVRYAITLQ